MTLKVKPLTIKDCIKYYDDMYECYSDNHLIFDCQNPVKITDPDVCYEFIKSYIGSEDATVVGITTEDELFLLGLVIFDGLRGYKDEWSSEVHIAVSRYLYGKENYWIYGEILKRSGLTTVYGLIPSYAIPVLSLCKKLDFKKTGYIPKSAPFKSKDKTIEMKDIYVMTWRRGGENNGKVQETKNN